MKPRRPFEAFNVITISKPAGSGPIPVRTGSGLACTGMGPNGFICAEGSVGMLGGERPTSIHAKIYPPDAEVPDDVPPDAVHGVLNHPNWHFDRLRQSPEIPCAACGPNVANAQSNRLVVWAVYPSGNLAAESVLFLGVCSNDTQCGGGAIPEIASVAAVPMNAPRQMEVEAAGFGGSQRAFEGKWLLDLARGMHAVWSNRGDGKKVPLIELRLDIAHPDEWRLLLRLGKVELVYVQAQKHWAWSRANQLTLQGDAAALGVPAVLRVRPV